MAPRRHNRLNLITGLAVLGLCLTPAISAAASHADIEISIPLDTVVRAPEDSKTQLATVPVPGDFADHLCEVRAHAENQRSVHPGNDLLIESGDSEVLLSDVEAAPGQVIVTDDLLELGDVITVSLSMGSDELFSAGFQVVVGCHAEETTTTVTLAPEETTTTAAVSPTEDTTTTVTLAPEETTTTAEVSPAGDSTSTSIEDEVKGIEVLPFTGREDFPLGQLALALFAGGVLVVIGTRRTND